MNKIFEKMKSEKVVGVIRCNDYNDALESIEAFIEGGFKIIEITFTVENVERLFKEVKKKYASNNDIVFGAGTVTNINQLEICLQNNLDFIVAPNFNKEIAAIANKNNLLYIPGVMTVNEIFECLDSNLKIVKLFPATQFTNSIIKDIKGPLPEIEIMPSGGVNFSNIKNWISNGAFACGVGSSVCKLVMQGKMNEAIIEAKMLIEGVK